MEFGKRLKELRDSRGWTQGQLAKELGVSIPTIHEYETGKKVPGRDKLISIAELFNTNIDYLLGLTDAKEPVEEYKELLDDTKIDIANLPKYPTLTWRGKPLNEAQVDFLLDFLELVEKQVLNLDDKKDPKD